MVTEPSLTALNLMQVVEDTQFRAELDWRMLASDEVGDGQVIGPPPGL